MEGNAAGAMRGHGHKVFKRESELSLGSAPVKFGPRPRNGTKKRTDKASGGAAGQARLLFRMVIEGMSIHEKP